MPKRFDSILTVCYSVRGLGLLSSGVGMVIAEQRCRILRDVLSSADAGERRSHLLLAVAVGRSKEVLQPKIEGGIMQETASRTVHKAPPSVGLDGFSASGINALQDVQLFAQGVHVQRQESWRSNMLVVPLAPLADSAMRDPSAFVRIVSTYGALCDANFTAAVESRMSELGGAYETLRDLRTTHKLQPYCGEKPTFCFTQEAARYPLRKFALPADPRELVPEFLAVLRAGQA